MIDGLKHIMQTIDHKKFTLYTMIFIASITLFVCGILVWHYYTILDMQQKIRSLNQARTEVQHILTEFTGVAKQREKVDALLKQDKNFYIQKYCQDLLQTLHIANTVQDKPLTQKLENGYTEESLMMNLTRINTQQLCDLLQNIEKEERVYIKSIEISKTMAKKINVLIHVATLIPKSE